jgi:hypothetical protein
MNFGAKIGLGFVVLFALAAVTGIRPDNLGLLAVVGVILFLIGTIIAIPILLVRSKVNKSRVIEELQARGFNPSQKIKAGAVEFHFDYARRECAVIGGNFHRVWKFEQISEYRYYFDPNLGFGKQLKLTVTALDPAQPILQWHAIGNQASGEAFVAQMDAMLSVQSV